MSDITVTATSGGTINVSTGTVVGPLPQLQVAAGNGITINTSGGVSTISANVADLSIPVNLADLTNVSGSPSVGQVLAWDGSTWAPADDQAGGSSDVANLADLGDVSASSPITGQALIWSGSAWDAANAPVTTQVNGLSGNITLASAGGVIVQTSPGVITITGSSSSSTASADQLASVVGPGLSVDEAGELSLADETPRDVVLSRAGDTGLLASFSRQATADTHRNLDSYEVEFIAVPSVPAVVAADQSGEHDRTLTVQAVVTSGERFVEFGESSDNGSTWENSTTLLQDDSGVAVFEGQPWGSLAPGDRLYRVRSADSSANLASATYSSNFAATYDVLPYHQPVPVQAYSLGANITGVAAFGSADVDRSDINLAAANVTVGFSSTTTTYASSSEADSGYPQVFAGRDEYPENSTAHSSLLSVPGEGWGILSFRVSGADGNGDEIAVGGEFYHFDGNYTLPKAASGSDLPALFMVAGGTTASNLPAGVTAGVFAGGVGVSDDTDRICHLRYLPDAAQEFEFANGDRSTITLTANLSATANLTGSVSVEAQEMWRTNESNQNQSFSGEPTINVTIQDSGGVEVASASSSSDFGNAFASASTSLSGGETYLLTLTISHPTGGRGYVPQVIVRPTVQEGLT